MADYITTYTGLHFYPLQPTEEGIRIEDIAHALSLICRGNGHVKHFFSVGQHCINCTLEAIARGYSDRVCLACLLHDASEAYLSDVPRPFKKSQPEYQRIEDKVIAVIYKKFLKEELTAEELRQVKEIDDDMLYYDLKELLNEVLEGAAPVLKHDISQELMPFEEVERKYLELYMALSSII